MFQCQALHFVVIYAPSFLVEVISHGVVQNTRRVYKATVAKVSAVCKVQTHESVARVEASKQHSLVSLCARVGLYVGKLGSEQLFNSLDGQVFHLVNHLATAVITLCG